MHNCSPVHAINFFGAMSPENNARIGVFPLLNSVSKGEILGNGCDKKKTLSKDHAEG